MGRRPWEQLCGPGAGSRTGTALTAGRGGTAAPGLTRVPREASPHGGQNSTSGAFQVEVEAASGHVEGSELERAVNGVQEHPLGAAWCSPAGRLGAQWRPTWAYCCLACCQSHRGSLCSAPSPAKRSSHHGLTSVKAVALGVKLSTRWSWQGTRQRASHGVADSGDGACGGGRSPISSAASTGRKRHPGFPS